MGRTCFLGWLYKAMWSTILPMIILNPQGVWLRNSGAFPLYDPEGLVVIPAGVLVKAKYTGWLKGQSTVALAEDPEKPAEAAKPALKKA